MPSYHDVVVFVDDKPYIFGRDGSLYLTCEGTAGWRLFRYKELIGEEYGDKPFRIEVDGKIICGDAVENSLKELPPFQKINIKEGDVLLFTVTDPHHTSKDSIERSTNTISQGLEKAFGFPVKIIVNTIGIKLDTVLKGE